MRRELFGATEQQRDQPRQMREMSRDRDVPRFAAQAIANPVRWIVRLDITDRAELRQRIARAPERLGRLLRAELPAVPDGVGMGAARRRGSRDVLSLFTSARRERAARIDLRPQRVGVMNQKQAQ